jgi:quinol monooxygenase YgiN
MEDENVFCLLQEWDTRKDFEKHCESENYKVLHGAMLLLDEPCEILSCEGSTKPI